jgi:hypothetical protein
MVLDLLSSRAGDRAAASVMDQMNTLYRARPFTKAVPFNNILPGVNPLALWAPQNAYFEVGVVLMRAGTVGVDIVLADSRAEQPFMFIMPPTDRYERVDISPGYRSLMFQNASVVAWDPSGSNVQIKGVIYGWEVTPEGYYR